MIRIVKPQGKIQGAVKLPYSKSISNRLHILQYHYPTLKVMNHSQSDDALLMETILGIVSRNTGNRNVVVLDCKNAGTVLRFVFPLLCSTHGRWLLTGNKRMKERPLGELVEMMRKIGARVEYTEKEGFPPVLIEGRIIRGGKVRMQNIHSSQFVSAMILNSIVWEKGLELSFPDAPPSKAYILMTLKLMKKLGLNVSLSSNMLRTEKSEIVNMEFENEADWSSAAYFYEIVSLMPGSELFFTDLSYDSIQGDQRLADIYYSLGVATSQAPNGLLIKNLKKRTASPFNIDLTDTPDLVPSLCASLAALGIESTLSGVRHLKYKESDRLKVMSGELKKLNYKLKISDELIMIRKADSNPPVSSPLMESWEDHRIAMALAPLALIVNEILLNDGDCVSKSFPGFWSELNKLGFVVK